MYDLSRRLKLIASLVPSGARVCDIGTDHGYLSIYLKEANIASSVIATDVREKPLENAKSNIKKSGISGIETRLCDGLSDIKPGEVDTVIVAGMGGDVISGILNSCEWIKNNSDITLILQPMTSAEELRRFLNANGFEILEEPALSENSKLYSVILARYTGKTKDFDQSYYYIGKVSPLSDDGMSYIKKQLKRCVECVQALKKIPSRQAEYLIFRQAAEGIENMLNSNMESK